MVGDALAALEPDAVLIEGPPDAEGVLSLALDPAMQPPVALLIYNPAKPAISSWYPFADFSPEWVALQFALRRGITVQFMDLPQRHMLAWMADSASDSPPPPESPSPDAPPPDADPLTALAKLAGFQDGESWWDALVESRLHDDPSGMFAAIIDAMSALRMDALRMDAQRADLPASPLNDRREAHMRKTIRAIERSHERIAVICGAWHAPALTDDVRKARGGAARDNSLLKGLPSVKVEATWAPWTYDRLSAFSGYGAGITSPGWYEHLWRTRRDQIAIAWLANVAALLRAEDLAASTAQVIDAVRLAESLAALRGRALPTLTEMNEAALSVLCHGESTPMRLIERRLIVGVRMGSIPDSAPMIPLQRDLEQQSRACRLAPSTDEKNHDLDLRQPLDRDRSILLHRLNLLEIPWGQVRKGGRAAKGTFHEYWRVVWQPEFAVRIIEAARWGSTVQEAAAASAAHHVEHVNRLDPLILMLDHVLMANLRDAAVAIMRRLAAVAALTHDIDALMMALPELVSTARYSDVRGTDQAALAEIVSDIIARICAGLLPACFSLDSEAGAALATRISVVNTAISLLNAPAERALWLKTLHEVANQNGIAGMVGGRVVRLLRDENQLDTAEVSRRLSAALSRAVPPEEAAAWLEGFLSGGGTLLLHDDSLWSAVDSWLMMLPPATFEAVLPLMRRTFAGFQPTTRRALLDRARFGKRQLADNAVDPQRAARVLPVLKLLLGVNDE